MNEVIRLLVLYASSIVATTGIILLFGIQKRVIFWAVISSVVCLTGYEVTLMLGGNLFVACCIGSMMSAAYSDVMAHVLKVPATVMIIPGIVPLVPGGRLYYTMLGAVKGDNGAFAENGIAALLMAAGLAIGIVAVTVVSKPLNAYISEHREEKNSMNDLK